MLRLHVIQSAAFRLFTRILSPITDEMSVVLGAGVRNSLNISLLRRMCEHVSILIEAAGPELYLEIVFL